MNGRRRILRSAALVVLVACAAAAAAAARTPGTNGNIVFRRYLDDNHQLGALFTINPSGRNLKQLTHPAKGTLDNEPVWSPDGEQIAYEHGVGNKTLVYLINANGSGAKPLGGCSGSCAGQESPAWSPDGSKVAVGQGPRVGHESIWGINASGTGLEQLTQREVPTTDNTMNDSQPAWSPDGTRLVFVRHLTKPVPRGRTAMFLVNADGSGERQLTPWSLTAGDHPDWSPDGKRILFRSNFYNAPPNAISNIYTIRPDGTGLTRLTRATAGDQYLSSSYSPEASGSSSGWCKARAKRPALPCS